MLSEPIRTTDYQQYLEQRTQVWREKDLVDENKRLRESAHRTTMEAYLLRCELERSEAIRYSLQERLVVALAGYEQLEEVVQTCPDRT